MSRESVGSIITAESLINLNQIECIRKSRKFPQICEDIQKERQRPIYIILNKLKNDITE